MPLSALAVRALEQQKVRQAKERLAAVRSGSTWPWFSPARSALPASPATSTGVTSTEVVYDLQFLGDERRPPQILRIV
jgi:hypothetical protein